MKASKKMYELVCEVLGGDFEEKVKKGEHLHRKLEAPAMMPLVIEAWQEGNEIMVSVAHYGKVNGDAMRDPEIVYRVVSIFNKNEWGKALQPTEFQNDYLQQYHVAVRLHRDGISINKPLLADLTYFSNIWAENIRAEGFLKSLEKR